MGANLTAEPSIVQGGFDRNRFVNSEISDNFLCKICHSVLRDPVQCPNQHYFCGDCITQSLKVRQECPLRCEGKLRIADLKDISRPFLDLLNRMLIKCEFEEFGCKEVTELEFVEEHYQKCEFRVITYERRLAMELESKLKDALNSTLCSETEGNETDIKKILDTIKTNCDYACKLLGIKDLEVDHYIKQLAELNLKNEQLNENNENLESAVKSALVQGLQGEIANCDKQQTTLKLRIKELEMAIKERDEHFEYLNTTIDSATKETESWKTKYHELSDDLTMLCVQNNQRLRRE